MSLRILSVTTMDDLRNYFGRGEVWQSGGWKGETFEGETRFYQVRLKPIGVNFRVRVEAVDDPSDSEDIVTEEPVKALAEFLGRDLPGGEHFERMASSPDALASVLRLLASSAASGAEPVRLVRRVRRAAAMPGALLALRAVAAAMRAAAGTEDEELARIEREMESKGWRVERTQDDRGLPEIRVDVSGIYEARISFEGVMYEYEFGFRGRPDLSQEGVTDDPIREFQAYYRSDPVEDAWKESDRALKERAQGETVPSGPRGPSAEEAAQ